MILTKCVDSTNTFRENAAKRDAGSVPCATEERRPGEAVVRLSITRLTENGFHLHIQDQLNSPPQRLAQMPNTVTKLGRTFTDPSILQAKQTFHPCILSFPTLSVSCNHKTFVHVNHQPARLLRVFPPRTPRGSRQPHHPCPLHHPRPTDQVL